MKLYLIRHGKAERQSNSGKDIDRKLSSKGMAQSEILGSYLKELNISPNTLIWCSAAVRTRETLQGLRSSIPFNIVLVMLDLYLCSKDEYLKKIWAQEHSDDLIIIGHNFGISELAEYFSEEFIELKTAEFICIKFDADTWSETSRGLGAISDRYRPSVDL